MKGVNRRTRLRAVPAFVEDGCRYQPFAIWLAEAGYYDAVGGKEMQFPNLRIMCKDGTMAGLMPRELK